MNFYSKILYLIFILFHIYWVFVQPFIGKDFSYDEIVSYCFGAVGVIVLSLYLNAYLITALLVASRASEEQSPVYYVIMNMAIADLAQSTLVLSLNVYQKLILLSTKITSLEVMQHLLRIIKMSREFAFLFGILYASGLAQLCLVYLLRVRYNVQQCTHRSVYLSLLLVWFYTVLCFTADAVYWLTDDAEWKSEQASLFTSVVECFVPLGIIVLSIISSFMIERNRAFENRIVIVEEEKEMNNKTLIVLTLSFVLFRVPLPVLNLVKQDHHVYEVEKMSRIAVNLYDAKCCVNPLLLLILHTQINRMCTELNSRFCRQLRRLGNTNNINNNNNSDISAGFAVDFDAFDQNVNIVTMSNIKGKDEENLELLP